MRIVSARVLLHDQSSYFRKEHRLPCWKISRRCYLVLDLPHMDAMRCHKHAIPTALWAQIHGLSYVWTEQSTGTWYDH